MIERQELLKIARRGMLIGLGKMAVAGIGACAATWLLNAPPFAATVIGVTVCAIVDSITFEIDGRRY